MEELYSNAAFYEHYKTIRNNLRKFDTAALVGSCLRYLHKPTKNSRTYLERHPWLVLLLIKWALIDEKAFARYRTAPNEQQLFYLLNLMRDLGGKKRSRMPSEYDDVRLFMRAMAYQQFLYQRNNSLTMIARQLFYFENLPDDSYIATRFLTLTGIRIKRFLELAQAIFAKFVEEPDRFVTQSWFSTLHNAYSPEEITLFLGAISKSMEEVRESLLARDRDSLEKERNPRSSLEYWEQTPFLNYPLLKHRDGYVCVDNHVLFYCIENYIYNLLRADNAKVFMSHFGFLFERYVEKAISHMSLPFVIEDDIKKILGPESSAIDFIIEDGSSSVFIDAKAAEMSYHGKSTHDSVELTKYLETSAIKAIKQAHSVLNALPLDGGGNPVLQRKDKNYLIVVTYSELYVGSGRTLSACIGAEKLNLLLKEYPQDLQIPVENMYVMTIKEFELLAECVHSQKLTLTKALDHAIAEDNDPYTQKFEFQQHLISSGVAIAEPNYLVTKAVAELESLAKHLST